MTLTLRYAARSDRGLIRDGNQDSVYAGPRLLAVADGMGGMAAGDVASNITIGAMAPLDEDVPGDALVDALRSAVDSANQQLRDVVDANPSLEGMGTTLTAMLFSGSKFGMVHVGDSRAYLLRDGEFVQVTKDDTYVQMLVDEGRISAEEASSHPQRSLLTRALDGRDIDPEYSIRQAVPGDRYMICSDGLSSVVSAETIAQSMREYVDPAQCVDRLIQLALRSGGPDNITVIVADVLDLDTGDTLAGQLSDTPVVVGAVAENQHQPHDNGIMQTPAGRASGLGRQGGGGGEFGPPGSGDTTGFIPAGSFGAYSDEDFVKPRAGRKWLKRSLYTALALAVVGGGLYGGYRWTQTQYYVGTNDDHVALYRGISQDLAWVSLSELEKDHPEIELKYLPPYWQKQVKNTIAEGDLATAQRKIDDLAVQASACRKQAERRTAENEKNAQTGQGQAGGTTGTTPASLTSKASPSPSVSATPKTPSSPSTSPSPTATPNPGPTLSEEEQKVVSNCGTQ